jgi:PII-like signaling protein
MVRALVQRISRNARLIGIPTMIPHEAALLSVYLNVNDRFHGSEVYRAVVEAARRFSMAGASVFPVELGYGSHQRIHDMASEYSSFEIPIVVELIDSAEKVKQFADALQIMVGEGMSVMRAVAVVRYTHGLERPLGDAGGPPDSSNPDGAPDLSKESSNLMKIEGQAKRVTIYVGSSDTWGGHNLAVAIVEKCRKLGMAGATVSRGVMGFGKHSVIHKAHLLGLSADLPEKIEIIDQAEQIELLLPALDPMIGGGLIVIEDVQVARYSHDQRK